MFNWFVVTSAINVSYNDSNFQKRFDETCMTLDSIVKYCPNPKIILMDGSPKKMERKYVDELLKKTTLFVQHYDDPMIERIHSSAKGNMQYVKSPSEIHLMLCFLKNQTFVIPEDRIFKLSARYQLNENFNLKDHEEKNTIVFKNKEPAVTYYDRETGKPLSKLSDYQYKTRLYSFCAGMLPYMINKYESMLLNLFRIYSSNQFTDIEHVMYHALQEIKVKQVPVIGVSGASAENGQMVNE